MSNEYINNFMTADDSGGFAPWQEQPITIPLNEWTELLLDNADLRSRLDALAIRWSESNERVRHLENDLAMMRGAMGEVE